MRYSCTMHVVSHQKIIQKIGADARTALHGYGHHMDMTNRKSAVCRLVLLVFVFGLLAGCVKLPDNSGRSTTFALEPDPDGIFGKKAEHVLGTDTDESAFLLLGNGLDAFVARAAMARHAETSIDAQYYLLHNDEVGRLFLNELLGAADRGVRVRLLVDDMDMGGRDFGAAVLDSHPHIEVRLFNPFSRESNRALQFISGWGEQTRRAHNKSYTVDSIITVIGGRNIGNEYFVADPGMSFLDLDVMALGPAAALVAGSFDQYWNSELSYPISLLMDSMPTPEQIAESTAAFKADIAEQGNSVYVESLREAKLAQALADYQVELITGKSRVYWDHPSKLLSWDDDADMMIRDIMPELESVTEELIVISPYFVPGKKGTAFFKGLRARGVRVVILTNSLTSTDVSLVHAGYSKYRKELLKAGVELYELNRDVSAAGRSYKDWKFYQSKASLHAKCFVMDRTRSYIGSLNLDARSVIHNTEIGLIIESPEIAQKLGAFIDSDMADLAFRLQLEEDFAGASHIVWDGIVDGERTVLDKEPYTGFWQRFMVGLMRWLPIESQL